MSRPYRRSGPYTDGDYAEMFKLHAAGVSQVRIAAIKGCTEAHVWNILHRKYPRQARTPGKWCSHCGGHSGASAMTSTVVDRADGT
jgi:hypothetical protein